MNIIKSLSHLNEELKETNTFNFESYKLIGRQIGLLPYEEQKLLIKILMESSIQSIHFTFYTFILQEYINTIKSIDSYDVENISKIFVDNIFEKYINYNLIKFIDFLYPIDWSVLTSDKLTIVSKCLLYLREINYTNITNYENIITISTIIDFIEYIVQKGNFLNEDDSINVKILFQYLSKDYNRLDNLKKYFQYTNKTDIDNIINMVSNNKDDESIIEKINKYCISKNLDTVEIMNVKSISNLNIYCYSKNYNTFRELFECEIIIDKILYSNSNKYNIIYNNIQDDNFIEDYLGVIELDNKEKRDKHNNEIKSIISKYIIHIDKVWKYIL